MPYDTVLARWFFEPLGMTRTGRPPAGVGREDVITYHAPRTTFASPLDRPDTVWNLIGNGGLLSTAGDLHRWIRGLVDGRVLDATARDQALSARVRVRPGRDYGLGWFISDTPWGDRQVWHSGGSAEGVGAELHWYRWADVVIIVLSSGVLDGTLPAADVVRDIEDLVFGAAAEARQLPTARRAWADDRPAPGRRVTPDGAVIEVREAGDTVVLVLPDAAATAALARFPQHGTPTRRRAAYETAGRVFNAMVDGDYGEFRELLWSEVPFEGEEAFWSDAIAQLTEARGRFQGIRFFATARDGAELEHLGLARFGDGHQLIRVHERPSGRLYFFTTPGFELPTTFAMRPVAGGGMAAFDFRFDALVELRAADDGRLLILTRDGTVEASPAGDDAPADRLD